MDVDSAPVADPVVERERADPMRRALRSTGTDVDMENGEDFGFIDGIVDVALTPDERASGKQGYTAQEWEALSLRNGGARRFPLKVDHKTVVGRLLHTYVDIHGNLRVSGMIDLKKEAGRAVWKRVGVSGESGTGSDALHSLSIGFNAYPTTRHGGGGDMALKNIFLETSLTNKPRREHAVLRVRASTNTDADQLDDSDLDDDNDPTLDDADRANIATQLAAIEPPVVVTTPTEQAPIAPVVCTSCKEAVDANKHELTAPTVLEHNVPKTIVTLSNPTIEMAEQTQAAPTPTTAAPTAPTTPMAVDPTPTAMQVPVPAPTATTTTNEPSVSLNADALRELIARSQALEQREAELAEARKGSQAWAKHLEEQERAERERLQKEAEERVKSFTQLSSELKDSTAFQNPMFMEAMTQLAQSQQGASIPEAVTMLGQDLIKQKQETKRAEMELDQYKQKLQVLESMISTGTSKRTKANDAPSTDSSQSQQAQRGEKQKMVAAGQTLSGMMDTRASPAASAAATATGLDAKRIDIWNLLNWDKNKIAAPAVAPPSTNIATLSAPAPAQPANAAASEQLEAMRQQVAKEFGITLPPSSAPTQQITPADLQMQQQQDQEADDEDMVRLAAARDLKQAMVAYFNLAAKNAPGPVEVRNSASDKTVNEALEETWYHNAPDANSLVMDMAFGKFQGAIKDLANDPSRMAQLRRQYGVEPIPHHKVDHPDWKGFADDNGNGPQYYRDQIMGEQIQRHFANQFQF
jgi:hypothetical protein